MKRFIYILSGICFVTHASAQGTVQGRVIDATAKSPLVGATITVAGKAITSTDKDGRFKIPCNPLPDISVSYIGYETKKQTVKNCENELLIALTAYNHNLDEVEITA